MQSYGRKIPTKLVEWVAANKEPRRRGVVPGPTPITRLVEATGRSAAAVHGWLTGMYSPGFQTAIAIERLTGVPIEEFGFSETLLDEARALPRNQLYLSNEPHRTATLVYAARIHDGVIKFGSTRNLTSRLYGLPRKSEWKEPVLLASTAGSLQFENAIHRLLHMHKQQVARAREYYKPTRRVMALVAAIADPGDDTIGRLDEPAASIMREFLLGDATGRKRVMWIPPGLYDTAGAMRFRELLEFGISTSLDLERATEQSVFTLEKWAASEITPGLASAMVLEDSFGIPARDWLKPLSDESTRMSRPSAHQR